MHSFRSDASVCNWSRLLVLTTTQSGDDSTPVYTACTCRGIHALERAGAVRAIPKETGMVELGESGHHRPPLSSCIYTNQG